MKMRSLIILSIAVALCWVFSSRGSQAQLNNAALQDETLARVGGRVEDFLREIARDNVDEGIDDLLVRSPLLKDGKRVSQLKESIRREMQKYGVFMGVESLKLERVGRSIIRCVYLYHCQEFPVVWQATFYRAEEEGDWMLISLKFNVEYEKLPAGQ